MIPRLAQTPLLDAFEAGEKVLILLGPRQVGKTTLLAWVHDQVPGTKLVLNGDFLDDRELLYPERARIADVLDGVDSLFVDEAQLFPEIGRSLKVIHDHHPNVTVLATGSSALDLGRNTGEPLTGRHLRFRLYPLAYAELDPTPTRRTQVLEHAMRYGTYPEVWSIAGHDAKVQHLRQLASDYVLKDIFAQVDVNRRRLADVLRLLALQVGSEISLNEIGRQMQMDVKTVSRYLDLLEAAFVIVRLGSFSRNLRKEVAKSRKIYFVDLGIRNALIQAFQPLDLRDDLGRLWENLMVIERIKRHQYHGAAPALYFWRTYHQKELDLIEEDDGQLRAFEFKRRAGRTKIPRLWTETYPDSEVQVIDPQNVHSFLMP